MEQMKTKMAEKTSFEKHVSKHNDEKKKMKKKLIKIYLLQIEESYFPDRQHLYVIKNVIGCDRWNTGVLYLNVNLICFSQFSHKLHSSLAFLICFERVNMK